MIIREGRVLLGSPAGITENVEEPAVDFEGNGAYRTLLILAM
jgi:hypothetical protein